MSKSEKQKLLIKSVARSMEAEGFNYDTVKNILEKQVLKVKD